MTDYRLEVTADFDGDGEQETIEYSLKLNQDISRKGDIPAVTTEAGKPEQSVNSQFQGKTEVLDFRFILNDDGTDKSNGTFSGQGLTDANFENNTVVTVEEQIFYLRHYMQTSQFSPFWRLYGGEFSDWNGDGVDEGTPVAAVTFDISENADNPTTGVVDVKLKVGGVA